MIRRLLSLTLALGALATGPAYADDPEVLLPQVVAFTNAPTGVQAAGTDWTPTATGGASGQPVTFTASPAETCERVAGRIEFLDAGECTVLAHQAGTATYAPADPAEAEVTVRRTVDLSVEVTRTAPYDEDTVTVTATAVDSLDPAVEVDGTATLTVDDGAPQPLTPGPDGHSGTLTGTESDDLDLHVTFAPADPGTHTEPEPWTGQLTPRLPQVLTFTNAPTGVQPAGSDWTPTATGGGSGQPVTFTASPAETCALVAGRVEFLDAGECTVLAHQAGTATHTPADPAEAEVTVRRAVDLGVEVTRTAPYDADAHLVVATATDSLTGLPVAGTATLTVDDGTALPATQALLAGPPGTYTGSLTGADAGTSSLRVTFVPDQSGTHAAPEDWTDDLSPRLGQTLAFAAAAPPVASRYADEDWEPVVTGGSSTIPVTLDAGPTATCRVSPDDATVIELVASGSCTVTARKAGSATHQPAPAVSTTFAVALRPVDLDLSWPALPEPRHQDTVSVTVTATDGLDDAPLDGTVTLSSPTGVAPATQVLEAGPGGTYTGAITFDGAGTRNLTATFAPSTADAGRWGTKSVTGTIAVKKLAQTVTIAPEPAPEDRLVDGDWTPATSASSGLAVSLSQVSTPAGVCEIDGDTVRFLAAGSCAVTATQAGSQAFEAQSATVTVAVRRPVAITVHTEPDPAVYGADVRVVATATDPLANDTVIALSTASAALVVTDPDGQVRAGQVVNGRLVLVLDPDAAGVHDVLVTLQQTTTHRAITSSSTFEVEKAEQTVALTAAPPAPGLTGSSWTPSTSGGGSGQPVVVSERVARDACRVQGGTLVVFEEPGTCALRLGQAGGANHHAADPLDVDVEVRIAVSIDLRVDPLAPTVGGLVEVRAVARAAGRPIDGRGALRLDDAAPGIETRWLGGGSYLSFVASATSHRVRASFTPEDPTRYVSASKELLVTAGRGSQAISLGTPAPSPAYVGHTWDPGALGGGAGTPVEVSFPSGEDHCALDGALVRFTGEGTCVVAFDQAGDADHLPAPQRTETIEVRRTAVDLALTWSGTPMVGEAFTATATATAPGPDGEPVAVPGLGTVVLVGDTPPGPVAWPAGTRSATLTPRSAGPVRIVASFAPDDHDLYEPVVAPVSTDVEVARGSAAIGFAAEPPARVWVHDTWTPTFAGPGADQVLVGVDAAVSITPEGRATCTIEGSAVKLLRAGPCRVTADRAADADYAAAFQVHRVLLVRQHPTTLTLDSSGHALVNRSFRVSATVVGARGGTTAEAVPGTIRFLVDGDEPGDPVDAVLTGTQAVAATDLSFEGVATRQVQARFVPADATTWAPSELTVAVAVRLNPQTISLASTSPSAVTLVDTPSWTPAFSSDSGLAVVMTATPADVCRVQAGAPAVLFEAPGQCTVELSQPGDGEEYEPALPVTRTIRVDAKASTTAVVVTGGANVGEPATATATSSGTGRIQFSHATGSAPTTWTPLGDPVELDEHGRASTEVVPTALGQQNVRAELVSVPARVWTASAATASWSTGKAPTNVVVRILPTEIQVDVTATPEAGIPTGTVEITVDGEAPTTLVLDAAGSVVLPRATAAGATSVVEAIYSGDALRADSRYHGRRSPPRISYRLLSPGSADGWHRGPVTIVFDCVATSAALAPGACPAARTVSAPGANPPVRAVLTATDGGSVELLVESIRIDGTAPSVQLSGTSTGRTYVGTAPASRCVGADPVSGLASCVVQGRVQLSRTSFRDTVVATDRAGNQARASTTFTVLPEWVHGATLRGGRFETRSRTIRVRVQAGADAPVLLQPRRPGAAPRVRVGRMRPITISGDRWTWEQKVTVPRTVRVGRVHRLAVRDGGRTQVLRVVVRR